MDGIDNETVSLIGTTQEKRSQRRGGCLSTATSSSGLTIIVLTVLLTALVVLAITLPLLLPEDDGDDDGESGVKGCFYRSPVQKFVDAMTAKGMQTTEQALNKLADENGGNRAVGTPGYAASVDYILNQLSTISDFCVSSVQNFDVTNFVVLSPAPALNEIEPVPGPITESQLLMFSGSGNVTAVVQSLPSQPEGCSAEAYANFTAGNIALVARGECTFAAKAAWATLHNASGLLVYNLPGLGSFVASLGTLQSYPAFGLSNAAGLALAAADPAPVVNMFAHTGVNFQQTTNVLCTTHAGIENQTIVVGSHLDSVPAGPGINDNGSGSSLNLELAMRMRQSGLQVVSKVVFGWWAAEEVGLLGSAHFVNHLLNTSQVGSVALNLNFDMIGSPNGMRGVYMGALAEDPSIRQASGDIEDLFVQYFTAHNLTYRGDPFDGRSDYGPFIAVGIPAGGLFTGAEKIKTDNERTLFGGWSNTPYDPCYHQECDTYDNIDWKLALENAQAAAFVSGTLVSHPNLPRFLSTNDYDSIIAHRTSRAFLNSHYTCSKKHDIEFA